jgi:hypothetical protein
VDGDVLETREREVDFKSERFRSCTDCSETFAVRLTQFKMSQQRILGNDSQREIIAVAAFVAGLEIVPVHVDDAAIRQVAKGARDRVCARVADNQESNPYSQRSVAGRDNVKTTSRGNRNPVRQYLADI